MSTIFSSESPAFHATYQATEKSTDFSAIYGSFRDPFSTANAPTLVPTKFSTYTYSDKATISTANWSTIFAADEFSVYPSIASTFYAPLLSTIHKSLDAAVSNSFAATI